MSNAILEPLKQALAPHIDEPIENHLNVPAQPSLPALVEWTQFSSEVLPAPTTLISNVLHLGSKMALGGGSKSFKTWTLVDMAISVASGTEWWGLQCTQGVVCYINLEIQPYFFQKRFVDISFAKNVTIPKGMLHIWNLRGYATGLDVLSGSLISGLEKIKPALIIIDPIYKVMAGLDENRAGDIGTVLNEIERLAVESGAAVAFGAHFAKGNASGKESLDRISGSGVFARDPDAILTMTRHEMPNCFTIEATLRNFPPMAPFVVEWCHPLMTREETLDPSDLKVAGKPFGKRFTTNHLLEVLGNESLSYGEFRRRCMDKSNGPGMSEGTFKNLRKELEESGKIKKNDDKYKINK